MLFSPGLVPGPLSFDLQSAYVPRGRYEVPTRAASAVLAVSACLTCGLLMSFVFYKVSTLGLDRFFWFHQRGIPRRTWGFYCSLRGHQRVGTAGFANPSFATEPRKRGSLDSPLSNPGGSAAAGTLLLPRVWGNIGIRCPVQIDRPQFGIWCSWLCSVRDRSRFSRFRWVLGRSFFIIGGMDCSCLRLLFVLLWFFVGFALTAVGSIVWVDTVMEKPEHLTA